MSSAIPITVVMRCRNDAAVLPRTMAALAAQTGVTVTLHAYDNASTDGSREILAQHRCAVREDVAAGAYWSSDLLNHALTRTTTDLVAFLNSDAVMLDGQCLLRLAEALLAEPRCAGVFASQVARADASVGTRLDLTTAFVWRHALGRDADCLSLVCSMIRRSAWSAVPFDRRLTYAEDLVWSRAVQAQGWTTRFIPASVAEHSHEYEAHARYRRAFGDAAAIAAITTQAPPTGIVRGALWPCVRRCLRDAWRLLRLGRPWWCILLVSYRWPSCRGAWDGAVAGWIHFHGPHADQRQPVAR